MAAKPKIEAQVRRQVLIEAGYRCAVPTCRTILAIDLHHLDPVSKGGGNTPDNLLALCPTCHALHHRGDIPAEALRVWKGMLVSLNEGINKEAKDLLLLLAMGEQERPAWYSAEGVMRLTPLIVARLVRVQPGVPEMAPRQFAGAYPWPGAYHVSLTDKGHAVIAAWKAGDATALATAQQQAPLGSSVMEATPRAGREG
jgi:hypothetical protein